MLSPNMSNLTLCEKHTAAKYDDPCIQQANGTLYNKIWFLKTLVKRPRPPQNPPIPQTQTQKTEAALQ